MRRLSYSERAARQFIKGTRCSSPIEVVEKGVKPLDAWIQLLAGERAEVLYVRRPKRGRRSNGDAELEHPFDAVTATSVEL